MQKKNLNIAVLGDAATTRSEFICLYKRNGQLKLPSELVTDVINKGAEEAQIDFTCCGELDTIELSCLLTKKGISMVPFTKNALSVEPMKAKIKTKRDNVSLYTDVKGFDMLSNNGFDLAYF